MTCPACRHWSHKDKEWIDGPEMDHKFDFPPRDGEDDYPTIYQCPKCKNIEVKE